jgi:PAS domain-containing protein
VPRFRYRASMSAGQSRLIAFVSDITAEAEMRERLALLTLVADRTSRAVVVTDHNLQVVYTNAAFTGMFGYSEWGCRWMISEPVIRVLAGWRICRSAS